MLTFTTKLGTKIQAVQVNFRLTNNNRKGHPHIEVVSRYGRKYEFDYSKEIHLKFLQELFENSDE